MHIGMQTLDTPNESMVHGLLFGKYRRKNAGAEWLLVIPKITKLQMSWR